MDKAIYKDGKTIYLRDGKEISKEEFIEDKVSPIGSECSIGSSDFKRPPSRSVSAFYNLWLG